MGPSFDLNNFEELSVFVKEIPGRGSVGYCGNDARHISDMSSEDSSLSDDAFEGFDRIRHRYYSGSSNSDAAVPEYPVGVSEGRQRGSGHQKTVRKHDASYLRRREKNNEAVRRSRTKARVRQAESQRRLTELTEENQKLQLKADVLLKELSLLRGLFPSVGDTKGSLLQEVDAMLEELGTSQ